MAHRFSNSKKLREEILAESRKFQTWESIPHHIRILILEHITLTVNEVLQEVLNER